MTEAATTKRSETRRVVFTVKALSSLMPATGKAEAWIFDAKTPALGFRVTANGVGAFYLFRRFKGRPIKFRLAGYPDVSIEQARALAAQANASIASGIDPRAKRKQDRADSATIGELVTQFIEQHAKMKKRSWRDDEATQRRYLTEWKDRRLDTVKQEDIRQLHANVGADHGQYAANRLLALLSAAYGKAGELWKESNPCKGVARFEETSRDRFLTAAELPRFFIALAEEKNETIRDYLLILLLVGQRRAATAAMRWDELDLARCVWLLPAAKAKNKKPHAAPLVPQAVQILSHRQQSAGDCPWVFPTASISKKSASGHIEAFKTTWNAILKRAEIKDFHLHDLRRSLGSWLAMNGASLPLIGAVLGHKSQATTQVYARFSIDPQLLATTTTAGMLASAPKGLLPQAATKGKANE